jgi:hypothetical protein
LIAPPSTDTPEDAKVAITNGAQGIGLCRTEHMFFATAQRIAAVRRMIAAVELNSPQADEALAELQGYQTQGEARGVWRQGTDQSAMRCRLRWLPPLRLPALRIRGVWLIWCLCIRSLLQPAGLVTPLACCSMWPP